MNWTRKILMILGVLLYAARLAQATPITIRTTGVVTDVRNVEAYPYHETIYAGVTFTGTYTYDSATVDSDTAVNRGYYVHNSPYGFNISLNGFEFKTVGSHVGQFRISILDDYSLQPYDNYRVGSIQNSPLFTGLSVNEISWSLSDDTHTALSSTILPSAPPNITAGIWSSNTFFISCGGPPYGNATFAVWGTITQAVLVPEPLTGALLMTGVLLLRRRR